MDEHAYEPFRTPVAGVDYDASTHVVLDELRVTTLFYRWCDVQVRLSMRKGYPTSGMFDAFKRHLGLGMLRLQYGYHQVYHVEDARRWMLAKIQYGL
jgi:hypothetical protein